MTALPKTSDNSDIQTAIDVIKTEIEGLEALAKSLDDNFSKAVEIIHAMKQTRKARLIIAGMGKSGHIANKITATLASTGTPAHYVHPGEASHGDMGMIMEDDVVLMISNSGETPELSDLIAYTKRFDIPTIAITSGAKSTLAKNCDILLLMPKMPEACPNGLAPTTSTTMTLALGDCLAVALLQKMGLTPEQFGVFHPGGKLGQKLLKVSDIMHAGDDLPIITNTAKMDSALLALTEKNLGCALVSDEKGNLEGIITDGDLKRHMADDLLQKPVTDIMSPNPQTIPHDLLTVEAVKIMTQTPDKYITSLVVVDDNGRLCGLIRLQDCIQKGVA